MRCVENAVKERDVEDNGGGSKVDGSESRYTVNNGNSVATKINRRTYRRKLSKTSDGAFCQGISIRTKKDTNHKTLYFYSELSCGSFTQDGGISIQYRISPERNVCLFNHIVFGQYVYPTDAYIEMVMAACTTYFNFSSMVLDNVVIVNPLIGVMGSERYLEIIFKQHDSGLRFEVRSSDCAESVGTKGTVHLRGVLFSPACKENYSSRWSSSSLTKNAENFSIEEYYAEDANIVLGDFYRSLKALRMGDDCAIGEIALDTEDTRFILNPAVISAGLASSMSYGPYKLSKHYNIGNDLFLPYNISKLKVLGPLLGRSFRSFTEVKNFTENWIDLYLEVVDENGCAVLKFETIRLQRVSSNAVTDYAGGFDVREPVLPSAAVLRKQASLVTAQAISKVTPKVTPKVMRPQANDNDISTLDVAVIGMSCRYPLSSNVDMFWDVLKNGKDCITEVPEGRWDDSHQWYNSDPTALHTSYSRWGGFIDDVDRFDPLFFNISPSEAELIDPQQRLFLEEAWKTVESAGYSSAALSNARCGVFVGCAEGDYSRLLSMRGMDTAGQAFMGTSSAILAARISYFLNLKGPSLSVDTACSSSLAAIHLACMSIRNGESDLAIAGGVSLFLTPKAHILTSQVGMQSVDGRCFTFDSRANGTVFSEGCGVILLKPRACAENDRDNILGVIQGSGMNQDGKTNGITAPSSRSQECLIADMYKKYGINPVDISYVEAHGTATPLGDPIEVQALTNAFQRETTRLGYCAIGSVKTNIGHGSYSAGIAGFIKALLCMKHKQYVPTVHYKEANRHIDFSQSPFFVCTKLANWPSDSGKARLAAVSSFGFSGTNVHIVLEEYNTSEHQDVLARNQVLPPVVIPLSAKTKESLLLLAANLAEYLRNPLNNTTESDKKTEENPHDQTLRLLDIAYTLQLGRDAMDERVAFHVSSIADLLNKIDAYTDNVSFIDGCYHGNVKNNKDVLTLFGLDDDLGKVVDSWLEKGNVSNCLNLWVHGIPIDWNKLYANISPKKVSLPTYPFAKERCWVDSASDIKADSLLEIIHPLVHKNTSDLFCQRYRSRFDGREQFWLEYGSRKENVFAEMLFAEMASTAIRDALGRCITEKVAVDVSGMVWSGDVVKIGDGPDFLVELTDVPHDTYGHIGYIKFEIFQVCNDSSNNKLCATGVGEINHNVTDEVIDVNDTLQCFEYVKLDPIRYASVFEALNPHGSSAASGVKTLYIGYNQVLLNHIVVPDEYGTTKPFMLPPVLMNLVCKAAALIRGGEYLNDRNVSEVLSITKLRALSVKKIETLRPCSANMYCWIRCSDDGVLADEVSTVDIMLFDEFGRLCVRLSQYKFSLVLPETKDTDGWVFGKQSALSSPLGLSNRGELTVFKDVQCDINSFVLYEGNKSEARRLQLVPESGEPTSPIKCLGTYLVMGNSILAYLLAEHLIHSGATNLLLVGYQNVSEQTCFNIDKLESLGAIVQYTCVSPCLTRDNTNECWGDAVIEQYQSIDGIICTEDVNDHLLSPLNRIIVEKNPDFVSYFSFVNESTHFSLVENESSAEWPVAHVTYRNQLSEWPKVEGRSVCVDWLCWSENQLNSLVREYAQENIITDMVTNVVDGIILRNSNSEFTVFSQRLPRRKTSELEIPQGEALQQDIVAELVKRPVSDKNRIMYSDSAMPVVPAVLVESLVNDVQTLNSERHVSNDLKVKIEILLKIRPELFDVDTNFSDIGFDSIGLTEFSRQLSSYYGIDVNPTILFGYATIKKLTRYLLEEHADKINEYYSNKMSAPMEKTVLQPVDTSGDRGLNGGAPTTSANRRFRSSGGDATKIQGADRIAIIGMSAKFPMANNLDAYWENLMTGRDCISKVPEDRWAWAQAGANWVSDVEDANVKWGGFIDGIADFDADFFDISPREAQLMDPQQRLTLTYVYHAIEDAGYSPKSLSSKNIAVFIGTENSGYRALIENSGDAIEAYTATGTQPSVGPNRVSFFFDLGGPSEPIETACASALVAIRRGIAAINNGCEMAIVGGVNVLVSPFGHVAYSKAGMLSKDGRCKTFSSNADGFVRSEGVGVLVLKAVSQAECDNDHIYGVICGSAENHNGRSNTLTAPNPVAQTQLLASAYRNAAIDPQTVTYIETHGTGTQLGDSIEIDSIKSAFSNLIKKSDQYFPVSNHDGTEKSIKCGLGSVKTNIGHTELASGVASVIKVLLQMKHKTLVKSLNTEPLNPYIQLDDSPFYVVRNAQNWEALLDSAGKPIPRRAGVSSMGMGGVNVHVVLEEYVQKQLPSHSVDAPQLVIFSAATSQQLARVAQQILEYVDKCEELPLQNLAYTLQVGRDDMDMRLAMVVSSRAELMAGIRQYLHREEASDASYIDIYTGDNRSKESYFKSLYSGTAADQFVQRLLENRDLEKLAQFWVSGGTLPWSILHKGEKLNRMSLPVYPFALKHYWVPSPTGKLTQSIGVAQNNGMARYNTTARNNDATINGPSTAPTKRSVYGENLIRSKLFKKWSGGAPIPNN